MFCELPAPPFKLVSATDSTHVRVAGTLVLALAFNLRGAFPLTGLVGHLKEKTVSGLFINTSSKKGFINTYPCLGIYQPYFDSGY